jgi:metallo-beta-lactamase family protein
MVTGSCFYVDSGHHPFLVDCGMFQGREDRERNFDQFPFNPSEIEYVFLTHAHIDHCGRLPILVKQAFHGKIISTRATRDLVRILLEDSAKVQKDDFDRCERRSGTDCEERWLYSKEEAEDVMQYFETYPYGDSIKLANDLEFRMRDAGHILGSSMFEFWCNDERDRPRKLVFSGDLGQPGQRIVRDPDLIREADYVIVESTYGNRYHKNKDETLLEFLSILKQAQKEQGNVLMPSFAVERAQEILYELNLFVENGLIEGLEVYFDSPLAQKTTKIFEQHSELFDEDARRLIESGDRIFEFEGLKYVEDVRESRRLSDRKGVVILAGSGMCNGGRILGHLENNISDSRNHLVFSGYQVKGTKGREIIDGADTVQLRGKPYEVNIQIHTLGAFSAHADQGDLEYWLRGFGGSPRRVFLVHGDVEIMNYFNAQLKRNLSLDTYIPEYAEKVELE